MLWILAAALVLVLLARPRTRKLGFVIAAILAVVLMWAMQRSNFGGLWRHSEVPAFTPSSSASLPISLTPSNASAEDLQLTGNGAPWKFSGKLVNLSDEYQISSASFEISRVDCYEGAGTPDGCLAVWQGQQTVALMLPPRQSRNFSAEIWLHGSALRLKGTPKDHFMLVALTGRRTDSNTVKSDTH